MASCPNCKAVTGAPDWRARRYTRWANQFGEGIRIFCDQCGQWTDLEFVNGRWVLDRIVRPPRQDYQVITDKSSSTT